MEPDRPRPLPGLVLVLCGPSGAGKSTLVSRLKVALPEVRFSVSYTTRPMRAGEREGDDYHFVSLPEFERRATEGEFLEHAFVHGNRYGTHRAQVHGLAQSGALVVLDIDVQGAAQVRAAGGDIPFVFVLPPSLDALQARLKGRGTDSDAVIAGRLAVARSEMEQAHLFDYAVVNDALDVAFADLLAIVRAERLRRDKQLACAAALGSPPGPGRPEPPSTDRF